MTEAEQKLGLVEAACDFWFRDNPRVRSPFPEHIHGTLKQNAQTAFLQWVEDNQDQDDEEPDNEELVGVFEMFLFGEALKLVDTEDREAALTIHYPFMPRLGDIVDDDTHGQSRVIERKLDEKEDKKLYMIVSLESNASREVWQTEFLIPT